MITETSIKELILKSIEQFNYPGNLAELVVETKQWVRLANVSERKNQEEMVGDSE